MESPASLEASYCEAGTISILAWGRGGKHRDTKALSGFGGAGVVKIGKDHRGDTF